MPWNLSLSVWKTSRKYTMVLIKSPHITVFLITESILLSQLVFFFCVSTKTVVSKMLPNLEEKDFQLKGFCHKRDVTLVQEPILVLNRKLCSRLSKKVCFPFIVWHFSYFLKFQKNHLIFDKTRPIFAMFLKQIFII